MIFAHSRHRAPHRPPYGEVLARRLACNQLVQWLRDVKHRVDPAAGLCACGESAHLCAYRLVLAELCLLDPTDDLRPPPWTAA